MCLYLLSFVAGSIILQIIAFLIIRKSIHKCAFFICITVTFLAMLGIEIWATEKGLWEWSHYVTLFKIGRIPVEEMMLYCTSAATAVILFEINSMIVRKVLSRYEK